jgi:hypothetical protein
VPIDDGNPCTDDVCVAGVPAHPAAVDGAACSDGDACTQTDTCHAGACVSGNQVMCNGGSTCVAGACAVCSGPLQLTEVKSVGAVLNDDGIAVADMNGDGTQDLIILSSCNANSPPSDCAVSVEIGHGDGTFAPAVHHTVGTTPDGLAVVDLNGDGLLDLAVTSSYNGSTTINPPWNKSLGVLINLGGGAFAPPVYYFTSNSATAVVAADFDGDGAPDLAVADGVGSYPIFPANNRISIFLNTGNGTLAPAVSYPSGGSPIAMAAADLNGDGQPDLAVGDGVGRVNVLLGQGNGTFAPPVTYPGGAWPGSVVAVDVNGDGYLDLAAADRDGDSVTVLLNLGNGTFVALVSYPVGNAPSSITAGDLNGDGNADLAVVNAGSSTVSVLLSQGNAGFAAALTYPVGNVPAGIAAADLDGNGSIDLAVASFQGIYVSALLNTCAP